jgi:hypothetical protein
MTFCSNCGLEIKEGNAFCSNCGQAVTVTNVQKPIYQASRSTDRPTGIAILAVLQALGGLASLAGGILGLIGAAFLGGFYPQGVPGFVSGFVGIFGVFMIILAIVNFVVVYGFWTGQGWSWTIGIVVAGISIITSLSSLPSSLFGLIINVAIIYYLTRPYVKKFFGK